MQRKASKRPRGNLIPTLLALGGTVVILSSCSNACSPRSIELDSLAQPKVSHASAASSAPEPTLPLRPTAYAEAIRYHRFPEAAQLLDALPEPEQSAPEIRYARALVAIELNDAETALRKLEHLETEEPELRSEIMHARILAAKKSHDINLLIHFFGSDPKVEHRLELALAYERERSFKEAKEHARTCLTQLSQLSSFSKAQKLELTIQAHALLARVLETEGSADGAAREYLWLATEAPLHELAKDADERLLELSKTVRLSREQRHKRTQAFAARGLTTEVERELSITQKHPSSALSPATAKGLLARSLFHSRTDYPRAALLFAEAAHYKDSDRREYLYYEAQSYARAHQNARALAKYRALSLLGGLYAEHAAFQTARIAFLQGDHQAAITAYEKYNTTYPKGRYKKNLTSELPVARLAGGQFSRAEAELGLAFQQEKDELEKARLLELWGVAAEGAKKLEIALERYSRVVHLRPLSYAALLATARLEQLGHAELSHFPPSEARDAEAPLELELPDLVRRLHRVGLDEQAEQALQRAEPFLKQLYGERSGEALCELYGQIASARRRYQIAQSAASWSVLREQPRAETRWQFECIYPRPYEEVVLSEAESYQISPAFVYGVMRQESAFRPTVVSPAHAVGLMQIIPPTAQRIALELHTTYEPNLMRAPAVNIRYGSFYLKKLLDMFDGRLELAAASYNAGPQAVSRWLEQGEKLPMDLFVARIPYTETRNYVYRVLGNAARYAYLRGGISAIPHVSLEIPRGLRAPEDAY